MAKVIPQIQHGHVTPTSLIYYTILALIHVYYLEHEEEPVLLTGAGLNRKQMLRLNKCLMGYVTGPAVLAE